MSLVKSHYIASVVKLQSYENALVCADINCASTVCEKESVECSVLQGIRTFYTCSHYRHYTTTQAWSLSLMSAKLLMYFKSKFAANAWSSSSFLDVVRFCIVLILVIRCLSRRGVTYSFHHLRYHLTLSPSSSVSISLSLSLSFSPCWFYIANLWTRSSNQRS